MVDSWTGMIHSCSYYRLPLLVILSLPHDVQAAQRRETVCGFGHHYHLCLRFTAGILLLHLYDSPFCIMYHRICLLYTSDAADERSSVDLGGRRIIKKKI